MANPQPYFSDDQIAEICAPLVKPAAQYNFLIKIGLHVQRKPNGRPLLASSEFERVLGAGRLSSNSLAPSGDLEALRNRWARKNGTQTQER